MIERELLLKKKKRINWFVKHAVKKPVLFVGYIVLGLFIMMSLAILIKVPVYKTYQGECRTNINNQTIIELKQEVNAEHPIIVYVNRDENIWKINSYQIEGNMLVIQEDIHSLIGKEIAVDIEFERVTLLRMALVGGGNR